MLQARRFGLHTRMMRGQRPQAVLLNRVTRTAASRSATRLRNWLPTPLLDVPLASEPSGAHGSEQIIENKPQCEKAEALQSEALPLEVQRGNHKRYYKCWCLGREKDAQRAIANQRIQEYLLIVSGHYTLQIIVPFIVRWVVGILLVCSQDAVTASFRRDQRPLGNYCLCIRKTRVRRPLGSGRAARRFSLAFFPHHSRVLV